MAWDCTIHILGRLYVRYVPVLRDSLLVKRRTRDPKVASSNPGRSGWKIFLFIVKFVCGLLFGVRFSPVLPQWHVKHPGHSTKKCRRQVSPNVHTALTQRSRSGLTMPLSRHSVRIYQETASGNIRPLQELKN